MSVRVYFDPRDLWIGAYADTARRRLYICPVPMLVIRVTR